MKTTRKPKNNVLNVLLTVSLFFMMVPLEIRAQDSLTLFINTSEGGEKVEKRLNEFKDYLNQNSCVVTAVKTVNEHSDLLEADFIFAPLEADFSSKYQRISQLKIVNDAVLSSSILVRASTGIDDIKALSNVHMAFLSEQSITGHQLAQQMFQKAGIVHHVDKAVFTQTNIGAMSLLLHKDVFAAVVATPLADKWSKANDLKTLAVSQEIQPGGLFANKRIDKKVVKKCQTAFRALSEKTRKNKKLLKVFPAWVVGFEHP